MFDFMNPGFLGWQHEEQLNVLANQIIEAAQDGETSFIQRATDDLTASDLDYLVKRLKAAGLQVSFTLN